MVQSLIHKTSRTNPPPPSHGFKKLNPWLRGFNILQPQVWEIVKVYQGIRMLKLISTRYYSMFYVHPICYTTQFQTTLPSTLPCLMLKKWHWCGSWLIAAFQGSMPGNARDFHLTHPRRAVSAVSVWTTTHQPQYIKFMYQKIFFLSQT